MLRRDDGIDDGGKVVYVWESLYAQDDVIKGTVADARGVFGVADHCSSIHSQLHYGSQSLNMAREKERTVSRLEPFIAKDARSDERHVSFEWHCTG